MDNTKMLAETLASDIEVVLRKNFPNGYIRAFYSNNISPVVFVSFGLIEDINDVANKIRHNDPLIHSFCVHINGEDSYEASSSMSGLSVNPEAGSYMAMGNIKTPFRKTTGDSKKIVKAFTRFASRVAKIVEDNKADIYGVERIDPKYLEVIL
jgi:hypothetical protein